MHSGSPPVSDLPNSVSSKIIREKISTARCRIHSMKRLIMAMILTSPWFLTNAPRKHGSTYVWLRKTHECKVKPIRNKVSKWEVILCPV